MEILVFIKQVPDDSVDIKLNPATGTPNLDGVTPVTNAFDTYALEMATRFKEANGGSITVATIGGDGAVASIKECLAVGGDKGFLIKCDDVDALDAAAKATLMANAVPKLEELAGAKFDIIFTGKEATDYAGGITGVTLAAKLGVGVMTDVIAVDPADGGVDVKQMTESGYNVVGLATPCVVTIQKPDYDPRYPTIKSKMKARKAAPIISLELSSPIRMMISQMEIILNIHQLQNPRIASRFCRLNTIAAKGYMCSLIMVHTG